MRVFQAAGEDPVGPAAKRRFLDTDYCLAGGHIVGRLHHLPAEPLNETGASEME
jgi:hypothetical protein